MITTKNSDTTPISTPINEYIEDVTRWRRKFTDDELIELHNLKLYDPQIAKALKVHVGTIREHKRRLGLPYNRQPPHINSSEQKALEYISKKEGCNKQDVIKTNGGKPDFIAPSGNRYEVKSAGFLFFTFLQIQNLKDNDTILVVNCDNSIIEFLWKDRNNMKIR